MFLRATPWICFFFVAVARAEEGGSIDANILMNYYGQDGEHSPVTAGVGTEQLTVVGGVAEVNWQPVSGWRVNGELGLDNVTSASLDRIDLGELRVSGASRTDQRIFGHLGVERTLGSQTFGALLGLSSEFDYSSVQAGVSWSADFNQKNTTLSARFNQFLDSVQLIGIHGGGGEDDREGEGRTNSASRDTSTLGASFSQVLSRSAVGSLNLEYTHQWGFLSQPFQEVTLADASANVAEQLPGKRDRYAAGLQLNLALKPGVVQRSFYRAYGDSWGVHAHTIALETHLRLPTKRELWLFPILRYHTQTASDYYGPPGAFTIADPYFTADDDLSGFHDEKFGLGLRLVQPKQSSSLAWLRDVEWRAVYTTREDGLHSFSVSSAFHWGS